MNFLDCITLVSNLPRVKNQPLYINELRGLYWLPTLIQVDATTQASAIVVGNGETISVFCPEQFKSLNAALVRLTCFGNALIADETSFRLNDLTCTTAFMPEIEKTNQPCACEFFFYFQLHIYYKYRLQ